MRLMGAGPSASVVAEGGRRGGHDGGHGRLVEVVDQASHLLEGRRLHEDVVLGQQEGGYLRQLPDRRTVGVRDDGPQLVQGVVQVVHAATFAGVDAETDEPRGPAVPPGIGARCPAS